MFKASFSAAERERSREIFSWEENLRRSGFILTLLLLEGFCSCAA